jgi:hypothetical protein
VLARLTRLAETLGVNSLPVVGVFAGDWSWATALAVYWAENLIATVLIGLRLWLHRRWRAGAAAPADVRISAPGPFVGTALAFTAAHGVFLVLVFAMVTKFWPDLATLRQALLALIVMQGLAFGLDLWTLDEWPASRVNERADHLLGRVVLVHLSIIAGMIGFAIFDTEWAFFAVFAGLKALSDIGQLLPRAAAAPTPSAPPRWLAAVMRRFPRQNGESFEDYWARTHRPGATDATPAPRRQRSRLHRVAAHEAAQRDAGLLREGDGQARRRRDPGHQRHTGQERLLHQLV